MKFKGWNVSRLAASMWLVAACGGSEDGTSMQGVDTPSPSVSAGTGTPAPTAGKPGGTAGAKAGSAGNSSAAGSSAGSAGASASGPNAVAMLMSFTDDTSTGAAGVAGSGAKAGSGGSGGTSSGGAAGKAGASGTGSGAGVSNVYALVYGQATFTTAGSGEVDVKVEVMGCDNGKSYPVHIHEGTSCDSVMTQGGHWGAPQTPEPLPPQPAAGAGGASAAAGSGATAFMYRGEGIPDIQCTGTTGVSAGKRDASDAHLLWTIGTMNETDVVGHVVVVHDGADRIACGKIELKK